MQTAFPFHSPLSSRPKRPERLFFAAMPDAAAAAHIGRFRQRFICENHVEGTALAEARLHVSLHLVGDFTRLRSPVVYAAQQAAEAAAKAAAIQPFEAVFRSIVSFRGALATAGRPARRPLVLLGENQGEGEELFEVHARLGAAMRDNGIRAAESFRPHMTLLYGPGPFPAQAIAPIRFAVGEFLLIHSERGLARYNILGRWPLRPQLRDARS